MFEKINGVKKIFASLFLLPHFLFYHLSAQEITHITTGSTWKYNTGTDLGSAWRSAAYNDAAWSSGAAQLGYGDGDEATVIPSGTSPNFYPTYYFRKTFTADTSLLGDLRLRIKRDDGVVVYINNVEVYRDNMPAGTPVYTTWASTACADDGGTWWYAVIPVSVLVTGTNTVAVEVHQASGASSDVSFDFQLSSHDIVAPGDTWKYSTGTDLGTSWKSTGYSDAAWSSGPSELGYGDGDEATVIPSGTAPSYYPTYYFRNTVSISDVSAFNSFTLKVKRDDGVVVYVNGTEVFRENMPAGTPTYNTWASAACSDDGATWFTASLSTSLFVNGNNVIAVEIHQSSATSSDVTFNLELTGETGNSVLTRGPYLQLATPTGMTIRWRTNTATDSRVNYGLTSASLIQSATDNTSATEHIIQLTGLTPETKYYYSVGSSTQTLQGNADNFFITPPVAGTEKTIRVWATGDCGTAQSVQTNVRNAYESFIGGNYTDVWLLLGDNAYDSGFDSEYQSKFFEPYMAGTVMKQTVLFPAPGNHDYYNTADLNSRTTPYFQSFTLPVAAEAGGVASGTESYYSYNYGNIHFVSLDSYGTVAGNKMYDTTGAQAVWLKQDLAANTQKWTVAYWHHPPYTKGSHNSDTESDLVAIRNNLVRILDRYKVDLVLCGHSHLYERSKIMKGHYGLETTFNSASHNASTSSALYDGSANSCPYVKSTSSVANEGIVYVVAGSAGKLSGTTSGYPHNAMYYSNNSVGGSLYLEVTGNRLDAKFISETGSILDKFTVMKDVNKKTDTIINSGQAITLNASWNGEYTWTPGSATTNSISPAPVTTTTYYATDGSYNCMKDTFNVRVKINISGTVTNTICTGTSNGSIDITASGGAEPYDYKWSNGINTEDISGLVAGAYVVTVTDIYLTTGTASFTVGTDIPSPVPGPPIVFTGSAVVCPGDTATYSIQPLNNATSYVWSSAANTTLVSGQGTNSVRVYFSPMFSSGSLSVTPMYCTVSATSKTYGVSVQPRPALPDAITGAVVACPGDAKTYSIVTVADATSYSWTAPANATIISGQGTTSVNIQFLAGFSTGIVTVTAGNCSGSSNAQTLTVKAVPSIPSAITGAVSNVCGGDTQTYSTVSVTGVSFYNWVVTGAAIVSGQGTNSIRVVFPGGYTSATVKVQATTSCASSAFSKTITIKPSPNVPGIVSGPVLPVCGGSTQTYSISPVTGASGYNWVVTNGTVVSGQGTISVQVNFNPGYTSATVKVQSTGACVNSAFNSPLTIKPIGSLAGIRGTFYGYCGGATGVKFSVSRIASATSYTWSVPSGITITAGQGTDSVTVNIASVFGSGIISVYASNACGNSAAVSSIVRTVPPPPGAVSGSSSVCPASAAMYSISAVLNATSYLWIVPSGWTILSGQGTTVLNAMSGTSGGYVKIAALNACGTGPLVQKNVSMASCKNSEDQPVEEINALSHFDIFPNPAGSEVNFRFGFHEEGEGRIIMFDMQGNLVAQISGIAAGKNLVQMRMLDIGQLADGIYFVQLHMNKAVLNRKLIIAR